MENNKDKIILSWTVPEFIRHEKDQLWFIGLGIITVILLTIAVLMSNYVFALIILLSALLIAAYALKHPRQIKFIVTPKEIIIDNKSFPYGEIISFWIFEEPGIKMLNLKTKKMTHPLIQLPLGEHSADQLKKELNNFTTN